ncbi:MAG: hypothetical protein HOO06_04275 [Bdellovibrionaceae bacterium]|jgi:hypothetical protein|nr:hypothetical protein [Pseudobdellovibrionaceae bacterium]
MGALLRYIKFFISISFGLVLMVCFQNCSKPLILEESGDIQTSEEILDTIIPIDNAPLEETTSVVKSPTPDVPSEPESSVPVVTTPTPVSSNEPESATCSDVNVDAICYEYHPAKDPTNPENSNYVSPEYHMTSLFSDGNLTLSPTRIVAVRGTFLYAVWFKGKIGLGFNKVIIDDVKYSLDGRDLIIHNVDSSDSADYLMEFRSNPIIPSDIINFVRIIVN